MPRRPPPPQLQFRRSRHLAHASIPLAQAPWGLTGRAWLQAWAQRVVIVVVPSFNSLGIDSRNVRSNYHQWDGRLVSRPWGITTRLGKYNMYNMYNTVIILHVALRDYFICTEISRVLCHLCIVTCNNPPVHSFQFPLKAFKSSPRVVW